MCWALVHAEGRSGAAKTTAVSFACCSCHIRAQALASKGYAGLRNSKEVRLKTGLTLVLSCSTHR